MQMKGHLDYLIRSAIDWRFRKRRPGIWLIRGGLSALIVVVAGSTLSISIPTPYGEFSLSLVSNGSSSKYFVWLLALVAIVCVAVGFLWEARNERRAERKRVIVIEGRGLRDIGGRPLSNAVPDSIEGRRQLIYADVRESVEDGVIRHPEAALPKLLSLPVQLKR